MTVDERLNYQPADDLLKDRVILITGASDGIGRALSLAAAKLGATVVLLSKTISKLEKVYDEIEAAGSPQPAIYPMNFKGATVKDYQDLADNIEQQLGRLDGLVNNAGWIGVITPFTQLSPELYQQVMTVNLHAPFLLTQAVLPLLQKADDPSIVFSTHECQRAYWGAFGVAKAGQEGLLKILAHEYSGENPIRVNGIDTGPVNTQMRRHHYPGEDWSKHPAPEDVIAPYLYFLGPDSADTSGENMLLQPS
ncbi:MAG TPA: YciK family oxidoreductase [Chromatiales bacterium]|nr:YciK family oxidoreductase [Thiotrichales bacterium]HIP67933.1 YciK family oxidoreductase [Chromatiales bacterium]